MPISDDLNPRNFITKITKYQKVVNIPNSMSVLTELLPVSISMSERKLTVLIYIYYRVYITLQTLVLLAIIKYWIYIKNILIHHLNTPISLLKNKIRY